MPKTSVADKTLAADSVVEVPQEEVLDAGPDKEYLPDGHPNPKAWNIWDFMQELSEKDFWQHYIGYLWRVFPKHAPTDRAAYIAAVVSPLTLEMVRQLYGGKKFTLQLNRRVGTRQKQVYKEQFDVDAPVIWQDGEVPLDGTVPLARGAARAGGVSTPDPSAANRDDMLNKLLDDLITQRNQAEAQGQSFDAGEALSQAVALMNTGFTSALTSVTGNLGKGDNAIVTVLGNMLTELIKVNASKKDDPIMQMLLTKALEKAAPENPLQAITAMLTLLKELGVKIGSGRPAEPGSEWAGVVEKGLEKLPEILSHAARFVPQRGAPGPPARLLTVSPAPAPAATPAATPAPANLPPEVSAGQESDTPPAPVPPDLVDMIAQNVVKTAIVRMLYNGDSGDEAAHSAEMAHEPLARRLAEILKTNPAELQQDPILSQALTHANVLTFSKEFIAYFEEDAIPPEGFSAPQESAA